MFRFNVGFVDKVEKLRVDLHIRSVVVEPISSTDAAPNSIIIAGGFGCSPTKIDDDTRR